MQQPKTPFLPVFPEISLENYFKSNINHDYDIGNIQQPYSSNIIVAVYLTVGSGK